MKPETADKIQNRIYQRMSPDEKIKIVSQFFEFGKKLSQLKKQGFDGNTRTSFNNKIINIYK